MIEQQQTQQPIMIYLVSPSGKSRVIIHEAVKNEYLGWQVIIVPEPQQNGAQSEAIADGNDNSDG